VAERESAKKLKFPRQIKLIHRSHRSYPQTNPQTERGSLMRIDDEIGMAWWNALSDQDRTKWASLARTGRAKDAWELFKASTEMRNDVSEPSRRRSPETGPTHEPSSFI
jgi:hypothetical protein